nr:hypothetical protein [uncultured Fusobacterium sp.]
MIIFRFEVTLREYIPKRLIILKCLGGMCIINLERKVSISRVTSTLSLLSARLS